MRTAGPGAVGAVRAVHLDAGDVRRDHGRAEVRDVEKVCRAGSSAGGRSERYGWLDRPCADEPLPEAAPVSPDLDVVCEAAAFADLRGADLLVDGYYFGDRRGNAGNDPSGQQIPVGNQGGFRFRGSSRADTVRIAALFSTGRDPDWPDWLDELTGLFTYCGDNKSRGPSCIPTEPRGNLLLRDTFAGAPLPSVHRTQPTP